MMLVSTGEKGSGNVYHEVQLLGNEVEGEGQYEEEEGCCESSSCCLPPRRGLFDLPILGGPPYGEVVLGKADPADLMPGFTYPTRRGQWNFFNLHAVVLGGPFLEEAKLRAAIDELQRRNPRLRAKYYENPLTKEHYLLETQKEIPLFVRSGGQYADVNHDLEKQLSYDKVDYFEGPFCWLVYVRHDAQEPGGSTSSGSSGLLIFANTHGCGDGRSCEILMASLLKIYDGRRAELGGGDDPKPANIAGPSIFFMRQEAVGSGRDLVEPEKLLRWRKIEAEFPQRERHMLNQTFIDQLHPNYSPYVQGSVVEILRLTPDEIANVLQACREAKTTVTGALVAAIAQAYLQELVARGRGSELLEFGMDVDNRRFLPSTFKEAVGNYVTAQGWRTRGGTEFWTMAKEMHRFLEKVIEEDIAVESHVVAQGGMSTEQLQLGRMMDPGLLVGFAASAMAHVNVSSLGVLRRFDQKFRNFQVLENLSAANLLGVKVNALTSGASGTFSVCVMVSDGGLIPEPRELARSLRDQIGAILRDLPLAAGPPAGLLLQSVAPPLGPPFSSSRQAGRWGAVALAAPVIRRAEDVQAEMESLIMKHREKYKSAHRSKANQAFLGDTSGASQTWGTHVMLVLDFVLACLAAGPLSAFPIYEPYLRDAGVFNHVCPEEKKTCEEQEAALSLFYTVTLNLIVVMIGTTGYAFDVWGPRRSSALGAMVSCVGLCLLAVFIHLDARKWGLTQIIGCFLCFILSDLGGLLASFGILGWMWHYPRQQTFIMGLENASFQASALLGFLFQTVVEDWGWHIAGGFLLAAGISGVASVGLFLMNPSREVFLAEAGKVLDVSSGAMDFSSIVGMWHFKWQMKELRHILWLFPWQNYFFIAYNGTMLAAVTYSVGNSSVQYARLQEEGNLSDEEVRSLKDFFLMVWSVIGLLLNPLAGMLLDRIGYKRFFVLVSVVVYLLVPLVFLHDARAQKLSTTLTAIWFSTYQTVQMKQPAIFAPPDLYGVIMGGMLFRAGILSLLLTSLAWFLLEFEQVSSVYISFGLFLAAAFAATGCIFVNQLFGIPRKPPKDRYGPIVMA